MSTGDIHLLRSDAQDNHGRILSNARQLFIDSGIDVTMREVARVAGISPATLYRRFPTKDALLDAVFAGEVRACTEIVERAWEADDPWEALCAAIYQLCALGIDNWQFVHAIYTRASGDDGLSAHRTALARKLMSLADRAKEQGKLRDDCELDDLLIILAGAKGVNSRRLGRDLATRRYAALVIDGLRASVNHSPLPKS